MKSYKDSKDFTSSPEENFLIAQERDDSQPLDECIKPTQNQLQIDHDSKTSSLSRPHLRRE